MLTLTSDENVNNEIGGKDFHLDGSGCGSVGRAVASDTRDLRFESCHRQTFLWKICQLSTLLKTKIKKKRPGMPHFLQKRFSFWTVVKMSACVFEKNKNKQKRGRG